MNRLKTISLAALLFACAAPPSVQATTFAALTLAQQAKKADVIVQATILAPTTVTEGANTYAVYPLKVSETLAGDAAMLPQTVGSPGGGGPALFVLNGVDSAPVFQAGQEAVLLLYKGRLDSPLVGYNQGAYLILGGQVSVLFPPLAAGASGAGQNGVVPYGSAQFPVAQSPVAQPGTSAAPTSPAATPAASTTTTAPATTGAAVPGATTNTGSGATTPPVTPPVTAPTTSQTPTNQAPATQPPVTQTPAATSPAPPSATTPSAEAPAATGIPASPSGSPTQPTSGPAPVPSPATVSVLGGIRTPAELKAAIVAARAAR
ncbi:hypothetical protein [Deinococcus sp.]|uniref:hypothetical protein n=1 Tax=Deinococcus sp. TaxID=47478 RepID=UPI003C7D5811